MVGLGYDLKCFSGCDYGLKTFQGALSFKVNTVDSLTVLQSLSYTVPFGEIRPQSGSLNFDVPSFSVKARGLFIVHCSIPSLLGK